MQNRLGKIGVIGGTGWLGSAIIKQMVAREFIAPQDIWVSNRSGKLVGLENFPEIQVTKDNQALVDHCDTIILAVRPHHFPSLNVMLNHHHVVISVMAGITIKQIAEVLASERGRIVRAMPNAAAEIGLSYTPWFATSAVDQQTIDAIEKLLMTFGTADRTQHEDQLDFFTALTGSGQGWVAFFESCLMECAIHYGITAEMAERSIRQLFLGMGVLLSKSTDPIAKVIQLLTDYAGTTAAGLTQMEKSKIKQAVESSIMAAYQKAKSDMTKR